jgi:hypothetical protein
VATAAISTASRTRARSGPSDAIRPLSIVCWTAMGTSTRPTVAAKASSSVTGRPVRNSGDSARPRRSVAQAPGWLRRASVIVVISGSTLPHRTDDLGRAVGGARPASR